MLPGTVVQPTGLDAPEVLRLRERAMSIVWKLRTPLPVRLFREFNVLRRV